MLGAFLTGMSNIKAPEQVQENVNDVVDTFELSDEAKAFYEECKGIECKDDIEFAIPRITMENNENFYNLAMAITTDEIQHYIATNEEVIYEGEKLKNIFDKITEIIRKAWAKLQGVFDKIFEMFDRFAVEDSKLVKKYKEKLKDFSGDVKYNGYEFNNENLFKVDVYSTLQAQVTDKMDLYEKLDADERISSIRATAIGQNAKKFNAEEFNSALKVFFYGGEEKKEISVDKKHIETLLSEIEECKAYKKVVKEAHAKCKKYFQELEKSAKKAEKQINSKEEGAEDASKRVASYTTVVKGCIGIANTVVSAHTKALSAARSQARAVIAKLGVDVKKEERAANGESASMLEGFSLI